MASMIGLLAVMAIPVTTSVAQGIKGDREEKAKAKLPPYFTLFSECKTSPLHSHKQLVLRDNNCYLNTTSSPTAGHPFGGYIRLFINSETPALVTSTSFDPPALGWLYVDKETRRVKYGNRAEAGEGLFGPWTYDAFGLNMEDWYGFVAVEEDGEWAMYAEVKGQEGKIEGVQVRLVQEPIEELIPTKK
ncbi:uncharacterized protein LAJ45_07086 [Morchella importuna]|uniref:uncharacterized protein n=1 Tax=Morchella importuna TaxID=1174673 RepID=UPI001E8E02D0|nr:uncharacterized protein LAJ45_07086 [Morchella importuna]KAH8148743.1 hypothetical protein LAJ45_07086 [Morchella importuna]